MTNNLKELKRVHLYLKNSLNISDLQEISNKCYSINILFKGDDGSGLIGGCLIDMFISKYFEIKLDNYKVYHKGEADMEICGLKLSQKKITGKSSIALNWSKNQKVKSSEELFVNNILLINLKTQRWCKKPSKTQKSSDCFNIIKAGIYLLDKEYCKRIVKLGSNNKTNALVKSVFLY